MKPHDGKINGTRASGLSTRTIAMSGVLAALVVLATQIRIPTAVGYANLGDGLILAGGVLLGPVAFFPAAIGSALSDLIAGYPMFILPTFLIKGVMGWMTGYFLRRKPESFRRAALVFSLAECWMIIGYFGTELILFGYEVAVAGLLPNLGQGIAGVFVGALLYPVAVRGRKV